MSAYNISSPHNEPADAVVKALGSSAEGLDRLEVEERLKRFGPNVLPSAKPPGATRIFLHQFTSPLIYILLAAAAISLLIREWSDAVFISGVLLLNAVIGTVQEYSAQRAAASLKQLVKTNARVVRGGDTYEISARELVPGDIVLLESGDKVPSDMRLLATLDLEVDESLLTGESEGVHKDAEKIIAADSGLSGRLNMVFAGTLVNRGRGRGVVVATALTTELGRIAEAVLGKRTARPPLLIRMDRFVKRVAVLISGVAVLLAVVALTRGMALNEVFLLGVALAVSAIPEGLPVALTIALAIGMQRMARRNVIVRRLVAVESLGSCTFIATDKTGTLTENQLTVRRIVLPFAEPWEVTGESMHPQGEIVTRAGTLTAGENKQLQRFCRAAVLANEGFLAHRDHGWTYHGDAVDVALLVMAHKVGVVQATTAGNFPEKASIPFESQRMFSASLSTVDGSRYAFVKGALERLLPMCSSMAGERAPLPLDCSLIEDQAHAMASQGYRVLALASGRVILAPQEKFSDAHLNDLTFLGLVCMIDPLRSEAKSAVAMCHRAGIEVAMVTGDHPATAFAIARELELVDSPDRIVTGRALRKADNQAAADRLIHRARVFARVEPQQKVEIVKALQRNGEFVAVSGDGANDAPALRAAQVGVAMGKSGTDVARETADLIITDDNFASIVAGVEEGRIAYGNVRKVIFLLISTGASELVLFILALLAGLPLPLLAVQLLWLNLVTNGIQDVALAFEPAEGDELRKPPRPPSEPIFNRLMVERVVLSALMIGIVAFLLFRYLLDSGYSVDQARNGTLLLMVLFENIHAFNSRSETRSLFRQNPLTNPFLLFGVIGAQLVHIAAMYLPWIRDTLGIQPVSPQNWLLLLALATSLAAVMEMHKLIRRQWS